MSGKWQVTVAVVAAVALVSQLPKPPAPARRLPRPDIALITVELISTENGPTRSRVLRIPMRGGTMLPPEPVSEGDEHAFAAFGGRAVVGNRYLVTGPGRVLDLRNDRLLNSGGDGYWWGEIGETAVTYYADGHFRFEYATGITTRLGDETQPPSGKHPLGRALSPDGTNEVWWDKDELLLLRDGEEPKSLGKGFKMDEDPKRAIQYGLRMMRFPLMWLDDNHFLTQQDHGKLVTVDLAGTVTKVVTIPGAPRETTPSPSFTSDSAGTIFYQLEDQYYRIDLTKKTAERSEWRSLGHGFESSWKGNDERGYALRYDSRNIGQLRCAPFWAKTAPGCLALKVNQPSRIAVWSAATGEWTFTREMWLGFAPLVGWIK